MKIQILLLSLLLGALADFLCSGVGKVVWMIIYAPCYVAVAITLATYLGRTRFEAFANWAGGLCFAGALLAHLVFVGAHSRRTFTMQLIAQKPISFKSKDFSETLIAVSDRLAQALNRAALNSDHRVQSEAVVDYGCIRSYSIQSVDDINLSSDADARWTLRIFKGDPPSNAQSPGSEDQKYPWCRVLRFKVTPD